MKINIGDTIVTANGERFECMTMNQLESLLKGTLFPARDSYYWGYDRNDGVYLSWDVYGYPINRNPAYRIEDVIPEVYSIAPDKRAGGLQAHCVSPQRNGRPLDLCQFQINDGKWLPFFDELHYELTKEDGSFPIRYLSVDA